MSKQRPFRMSFTLGPVWVSWEKGSDLRRLEVHGPLGKSSDTHYVRIEDTGDVWDATIQWNVGDKAVAQQIDSSSLRDFAYELLAMANRMDERAGRPVPDGPTVDPLTREFFEVFDPRKKK
jgi:hypothetical protein